MLGNISQDAKLMTDESGIYLSVGKLFRGGHETVVHSVREYARAGGIHTNTIEGFFSLLKRGIYGTFHSVSKKQLHRYLAEFEFRWNHRAVDDGARTAAAIRNTAIKRLTYKDVIGV